MVSEIEISESRQWVEYRDDDGRRCAVMFSSLDLNICVSISRERKHGPYIRMYTVPFHSPLWNRIKKQAMQLREKCSAM